MFSNLSVFIADKFVEKHIIISEDREIYQYGFCQLFSILLNIITVIAFGIAFGMILESIIFLLSYMLIRRYAGGFHAKTPIRCYIYSSVMILLVLLAIKLIINSILISIIIAVTGSVIIFLLSPVEDQNKPLDSTEKLVYRKKTIIYLIFETLVNIIMMIMNFPMVYKPLCMAVFCIGLLVFLGQLKNIIVKDM